MVKPPTPAPHAAPSSDWKSLDYFPNWLLEDKPICGATERTNFRRPAHVGKRPEASLASEGNSSEPAKAEYLAQVSAE